MPVSVPEKTLEHWASLYLTYRYRSKAALWWPVAGEDIDVQALPSRPGKAVQLELKTTVAQATQHKVQIDLDQLNEYLRRPFGMQPFYVFPRPRWQGELRAAAAAAHLHETELAFSRSGNTWWFAEWLVVLPAAEVAAVLKPELMAWSSGATGSKATLVYYHHPTATNPHWAQTWGSGTVPEPDPTPWRTFWSDLENCGYPHWPQLVRIPASALGRQARFGRTEVLDMLRAASELDPRQQRQLEWVTLGTDGEDAYVRTTAEGPDRPDRTLGPPAAERRTAVFLDARALFHSEPDEG